jgi:hypothetical protein
MQSITAGSYRKMETLRMVEDLIKSADDYPTESELWRSLPRKIPRTSFKQILHRLRIEGKIMYGKGRRIIWTEADELQSKIIREEFKTVS